MLKIVSNTGTMLKEVTYRLEFTTSTFEHHRGTNYVIVQFMPVHLDNAQISPERLIYNSFTLEYNLSYPPVSLKLEVSLLPALTNGSIWKNQTIIYEPWFIQDLTKVTKEILNTGVKSFVSGASIAKYFDNQSISYINKYHHQLYTSLPHDFIGFTLQNQTIFIPKTEIMRYFYLSSTVFNSYVFSGKIQDFNALINGQHGIKDQHLLLRLRKQVKDIDAFKIALLLTQKSYKGQLYKISNTISMNLNMDKNNFEINTYLPVTLIQYLETLASNIVVDGGTIIVVHKIISCNYELPFSEIDIDRDNGGRDDQEQQSILENSQTSNTPAIVAKPLPAKQSGETLVDNTLSPFELLSRGIKLPEPEPNVKLNKVYRKREKPHTIRVESPNLEFESVFSTEEGNTSKYIKAFKVEFIPEFAQDFIKELEKVESLKIIPLNTGLLLKNLRDSIFIHIYDLDNQKNYYLAYTNIVPKSKANVATYLMHFHDYHSDHNGMNTIFKNFLLTGRIELNKFKYYRKYFKFREQSTLIKIFKYLGKSLCSTT